MASDGETSCANDPNFAVIYSFLKVFGKLYGLELPTITKLQEFIENTQEVSEPLKDLHLRLLRRAQKTLHSNRWEKGLIKFCHQQGQHQDAWEIERFSYKKASTQVKLKILKVLLEYQFTCHPKFKSAVNAIECKDLRLDPIGRDKNGCVYWLQVDHEANLCLYKEDQDEETWQLVARSREELVKVIEQLKKGEEVCPLSTTNATEDSSGAENPLSEPKPETKPENEEDNEEEFLSPESETDHEDADTDQKEQPATPNSECTDNNEQTDKIREPISEDKENPIETVNKVDAIENKQDSVNNVEEDTLKTVESEAANSEEVSNDKVGEEAKENVNSNKNIDKEKEDDKSNKEEIVNNEESIPEEDKQENIERSRDNSEDKTESEALGEAIEEPVMHVTGEGNGADCESFFIGEEITEPLMYFYGEGWGYDNDTGNPDVIHETNETPPDEENDSEELVNGEHETKTNLTKSVKLKTVNKRSLKKQLNDSNDMKPDVKKPCVRDVDKFNSSLTDSDKKDVTNDKSPTDSESPNKSNVKKCRSKVKKNATRKIKINDRKEAMNSTATDNCQDKTSIIEKRKSSVSSVDHEEETTENDKEKSPEGDTKMEEPLPPKKLRLEATPESYNPTHSKEADAVSESIDDENKKDLNDSISKRKKIKASKGKFKRKNIIKSSNKTNDGDKDNENNKKGCKSLKRTLVDATMSDKNKTESQSESEDDEPITSGKRSKIKPKKIITSSRKKVEAKLMEKHSSDESEEETLYSLAGKKSTKKFTKKKPKSKPKSKKSEPHSGNESDPPVRQSRRIAQQKIKEEAERRHQEEVALRELKLIHKKKGKDEEEEEEWVQSGCSSSEGRRLRARRTWRAADSSGPDPDTDSDCPLFELHHHEPDLEFGKSDHEFSPESDLESGEPAEPLKRARTLQEEKDDGYCLKCGSAEQPEWILLCDGCDGGYHASCLKPMLFLVPQGDWFCPTCNHEKLIKSLESELVKYDELLAVVEEERARKKLEEPDEPEPQPEVKAKEESDDDEDSESSGSWSGSSGGVYRLRARRQLPVSLRAQEYDRLISQAIKEEYVEPTTSAGNQGRGKDISTIIEAAEEEKMKAEREAIEQGKPVELKKFRKKQRRKPRKLNSLDVPSEDDDETDEDFKDTGGASSSEDISSSAERDSSSDSRSSDSLPIRRTGGRIDKKDRPKMRESSPEVKKKKKGVFQDTSSESAGTQEWSNKTKVKSRSAKREKREKREKHEKHKKRRRGLSQYDAAGNVVRARVTYGGLSGSDENDWSPKHRTRQKKINYTEMPNTESEDEMHKSSGKHMPDSSDEFKISESDDTDDSEAERTKKKREEESEEKRKALSDLVKKTAVVPLEKLPEDVTKAKTEELQAHLSNLKESSGLNDVQSARPLRGRGSRGGRGARCGRGRGRGRGEAQTDDALAKLVGVKIKELGQDGTPTKPNQLEREKKRQEREAKLAEKEAKRLERAQKREEKEKMKEMKAKEREEKRQARLALQETKRIKKEKDFSVMGGAVGGEMFPPPEYRPQGPPRLQVRAELRGMMADERGLHGHQPHNVLREGTLSVAGSPQPFRPVSEEPSIITRMPHMMNQQYNRGGMMYGSGPGAGGVGGAGGVAAGFPRAMFPAGRPPPAPYYRLPQHYPPHHYRHMHGGPGGPSGPMHHPGGAGGPPGLQPGGFPYRPGPPSLPGGPHLAPDSRPNLPHPSLPPGMPQGKNIPGNPGPSGNLLQNLGQPIPPHQQNIHPPNMNPNLIPGHLQNMGPGRPAPQQSLGPGGPPGLNLNPPSLPPGGSQVPSTVAGAATPGTSGLPGQPTSQQSGEDMPIKIKAEVKTEQPEYRSPPGSPPCESAEPPRHPKIKVTERRPRFPLGPYAPHVHYPPHYPAHNYPPLAQDSHHTPHNMQQYGAGGPSNSTSSPPPRGYLPPGMRFPPGGAQLANGAPPPRHPALHQPFASRAPRPPPPHSPHPSLPQSPHRAPPSPHPPGVGQPPPARSPHNSAPSHRPPGVKSPPPPGPPPTRFPHHLGMLPGHLPPQGLQAPGVSPGLTQSPRLPGVLQGPAPSRSPHTGAPQGPSPSQSPQHPGDPHGLPPSQSPHHPEEPQGLPRSQSPHNPGGPHGPPPSQSPHHPVGPHGPPPSQSPHHPGGTHGPPPSQSPQHPGELHRPAPSQSPHHPGEHHGPSPSQSPHHPGGLHGPQPPQSPHHPGGHNGPLPSQSPHHPGGLHGLPPSQSPHHPGGLHGPQPPQSPHHPGGFHGPPSSQSPHHPGGFHGPPPSQSPHHPGGPHAPPLSHSPHNPVGIRGPPPSQSPHNPGGIRGPPPSQSPHHPGGLHGPPPSQSPHHPGGIHGLPPSQSPQHLGGLHGPPPSQSPHYPGGLHGPQPSQSPHHLGGHHRHPPLQSPHHPGGTHGPQPSQSPNTPGGQFRPLPSHSPHHLGGLHGPPPSQSPHHPGGIHGPPPSQQPLIPGGAPGPLQMGAGGLRSLHRAGLPPPPPLLQSQAGGAGGAVGAGGGAPYSPYSRLPAPPPRRDADLPVPLDRVKTEPLREEGSVFGGLVSYFSSQHEDDIDG